MPSIGGRRTGTVKRPLRQFRPHSKCPHCGKAGDVLMAGRDVTVYGCPKPAQHQWRVYRETGGRGLVPVKPLTPAARRWLARGGAA